MATHTVYTCDLCPNTEKGGPFDVPKKWITLGQHVGEKGNLTARGPDRHFCSWACLLKFLDELEGEPPVHARLTYLPPGS